MNVTGQAVILSLLINAIPIMSQAQSSLTAEMDTASPPPVETPVYAITKVRLDVLEEGNGGVLFVEGFGTASVNGPARLVPLIPSVSSSGIADFVLLGATVTQPTASKSINFETVSAELLFHDNLFSAAKVFRIRSATNVLEASYDARVNQTSLPDDLPQKLIGSKVTVIDETAVRSDVHDGPILNVSVVGPTTSMSAISEQSPMLILNTDHNGVVEAVRWQ